MKVLTFTKRAASVSLLILAVLALCSATTTFAGDPDPDRYIVSFLDVGKGKAALKAAGARIELELHGREAAAAHIPAKSLQGLRKNPHIEYIEKDVLRYPMAAQTTPWGIPAVHGDPLLDPLTYDVNNGARTICIIDSGYDGGHPDLPHGGNITGTDVPGTGNWDADTCYHGTHVAGTIAALDNEIGVVGVIPGSVNLHIVKVFDGANCAWSYSSGLVSALDKCIQAGANVVSMSLGGSFKSRTEERVFSDAYNKGLLSVAAAGNDGNTRKSYPASYDSVISVAAVDSAKVVADFSQRNDQVELAAPGVAVRSTVGRNSGTDEVLTVGNTSYEAVALEDAYRGTGSGPLLDCGLGMPGDCGDATGAVCLIQRGDITFAEKVQECEIAGGHAAVIFNNGPTLFSGTLAGVNTSIPSLGISGEDGLALLADLGGSGDASVTVATGDYAYYDGTSMATPHVSGVAALVWNQNSSCSNADVRGALDSTALDLGPDGRDPEYGFGLVQAADAAADLLAGCGGGGGDGGGGTDPPPPSCTLGQAGDSCSSDAACCSGSCKGKPGSKTCK